MKVYNEKYKGYIHPDLLNILNEARKYYREPLVTDPFSDELFNPELYVKHKSEILNKYMTKCGLDTVIIAVSGGVDSAVVLKLAEFASKQPNSPIKRVIGVTLPITNSVLTNQQETINRAEELMNSTGCENKTINLYNIYSMNKAMSELYFGESDDWADGQMGAYIRTSFLYYLTAVINSQGNKPILLGTTNRDEGSYIGYVGKASDGMVDVQLISDIYKSEVYKVAEYLNVPESILTVIPNGDMYDGRVDTEVFGAPYDIVELFNRSKAQLYLKESLNYLTGDAKKQWDKYSNNLEKLHNYNAHKYLGLSPAVHLDLWPCNVEDGYINYYERTKKFLEQ